MKSGVKWVNEHQPCKGLNIINEQIQPFTGLLKTILPYPLSFTQGYSHSTTFVVFR